ncbi:MAG: DUF983 domain-containing protein [Terrimicrobiaceae bacterium]|jgi:uncharacterized protein (DUF983 family)
MKDLRRLWRFVIRAMALKCPECGSKPLFIPWYRVRSLHDWFTPLDGCPRCGYAYERETGYFLLAIWGVNYGVGSLIGIALYLIMEIYFHFSLRTMLISVITPVVFFNIFFARHAKSLFLALDHFFDPHRPDSGDDGGNRPIEPNPPTTPQPKATKPCEPLAPVA